MCTKLEIIQHLLQKKLLRWNTAFQPVRPIGILPVVSSASSTRKMHVARTVRNGCVPLVSEVFDSNKSS